jgi:hypothetical protein
VHVSGLSSPKWSATSMKYAAPIDRFYCLVCLSFCFPQENKAKVRPNPRLLRPAMFKFTDIQTSRSLTQDEVLMINMIMKRRAYRYIAAADKEWLYPERHVSTDHWKKLGDGYLLMPEPRLVLMGGEILIGYKGGHTEAFSEYGHRPVAEGI